MRNINYTAPPTVAAFMRSQAFFRILAGPVGSGKTTGAIHELLRRAIEQAPGEDGIRYTRFAIVRQTLKQLEDTVLKDIEFHLQGIVEYKISKRTLYLKFGDVRSEWLLIPLEDTEDQRRLLSSQLTGCWMSESIEISPDLIPPLLGRCGRFPSGRQGKPTWFGGIADTNMPAEGSSWHKLMEYDTPAEWQVFIQPGGLEPGAENIENLPGGIEYYNRLVMSAENNPDWVRRYVHAKYGNDPSGSAVFRESFKRGFHSAPSVEPVHGHPLIVTQDFGRNPCALICQQDHKGRLLVLEEIASEDMGLELHVTRFLKPALGHERYMGKPVYVIGDPAGNQRSTTYEETSFDCLKREGLMAYPAPTNSIDKRLRAVESLLLQQRDGGAALLIDEERCPTLMLAMNGRYRYTKRTNGQLSPLPEKSHPWSDLADALQYACLVVHGGMSGYVANRMQRKRAPVQVSRISPRAWT
jgi:hypothetical protein